MSKDGPELLPKAWQLHLGLGRCAYLSCLLEAPYAGKWVPLITCPKAHTVQRRTHSSKGFAKGLLMSEVTVDFACHFAGAMA